MVIFANRAARRAAYASLIALASTAVLGLARPADAQLTLTLTPNPTSGTPGQSVAFSALLRNTGAQTLSLVGTSANFTGPLTGGIVAVAWNDTQFVNNLPFNLAAGGQYQNSLFAVIAANANPGLYIGTYSVDGATLAGAAVPSATTTVNLTVARANSAAPEPGTAALLALGILGTGAGRGVKLRHRRRSV